MARIRSIKPEFWTSEQIVECSIEARLLFIGLWTFCDDGGVHPNSTKRIKMQVFPADDYTSTDVQRLLDELSSNNLISFYEAGNRQYIKVSGWHHQKIDRPSFKFPQPCGEIPRDKEHYRQLHSTSARRALAPGGDVDVERRGEDITLNNKHSSRAGEFAVFPVDNFQATPEDLEYCEAMELHEPLDMITMHFRIHHSEAETKTNQAAWSRLFRGWVEKNRMPPPREPEG
jgi:hypothetical protein